MIKPYVIKDVFTHTMESNLYKYLEIKMHHYIRDKDFNNIVVIGDYDRNAIISKYEKKGKMFNWQRPTAEIEQDTLFIKCPSGRDYVVHYGSLISTYLAINNRNFDNVFCKIPTKEECDKLINESNLKEIKPNETAIIGYGLEALVDNINWRGEGSFLSVDEKISNKKVTFIGCKHSIWGDISGRVIKFLVDHLGVKKVIYIGKLGVMNKGVVPNKYLATGNSSYVEGKLIEWNNLFERLSDEILKKGLHYTSPSLILETKDWLRENNNFDFVDPEIGHMAKASIESGIEFSYLHIISNNLSRVESENLSNERLKSIVDKRKQLLFKIRELLKIL